jgi:hypothetical protein
MIDLEAGARNIEAAQVIGKLQYDAPLGKRCSRGAIIEMRKQLERPDPSKDVVPPIPRHRLSKNDRQQRPGDAAIPREQRRYDLVLKHRLSRNRGMVQTEIETQERKWPVG